MAVDGWIPVDPLTLETRFPGVYAVGDVTSVGTPKAGVFAEGQAAVVADGDHRRASRGDGAAGGVRRPRACATSSSATTRWRKVDVTFLSGQAPSGTLEGTVAASSPPTRPSSARPASSAGSGATWAPF